MHCFWMLWIGAAPAQVARQGFFYFLLGGVNIMLKERSCSKDKAGCAIATLHGMLFDVRINQGMAFCSHSFNGLDYFIMALDGECHTRKDRTAVQDDGAGPAGSLVAHQLGSCQTQQIVEKVVERPFRFDMDKKVFPIYGETDDAFG